MPDRIAILVKTAWVIAAGVIVDASATTSTSVAEMFPIVLDGRYSDWTEVQVAHTDTADDGGSSGIDFGSLWIADDNDHLFLRIGVGTEINLDEENDLHLYVDTDGDASTGTAVGGIGAELDWALGRRRGILESGTESRSIRHSQIEFVGMPTVTSTMFEIALSKEALGIEKAEIRVLFLEERGDQIPNDGMVLSYHTGIGSVDPPTPLSLEREPGTDLRIVTYNILNDTPWRGGNEIRLGRQLAAVGADILNFQEVRSTTPERVAETVSTYQPLENGAKWYAAGNNDCVTVSRFPILASWPVDGNLAVLIDVDEVAPTPVLVINAHLPCCGNDSGRQYEVDRILAFVRDVREPARGVFDLPENAPIFIVGDMNFVRLSQQLRSLVSGDIRSPGLGDDFLPDWDRSPLLNLISRHTERRVSTTWRDASSDFWPGHLDFVIYTDSVLERANHFILATEEMSPTSLEKNGLEVDDSRLSDHLLVAGDFRWTAQPEDDPKETWSSSELRCAPNPTALGSRITFRVESPGTYRIDILDAAGRRRAEPSGSAAAEFDPGIWSVVWDGLGNDGEKLPMGQYWVRLVRSGSDQPLAVQRLTVLR